jgi:hypothetical protein
MDAFQTFDLIHGPRTGLITIWGGWVCGKTSLAIRMIQRFPSASVFVFAQYEQDGSQYSREIDGARVFTDHWDVNTLKRGMSQSVEEGRNREQFLQQERATEKELSMIFRGIQVLLELVFAYIRIEPVIVVLEEHDDNVLDTIAMDALGRMASVETILLIDVMSVVTFDESEYAMAKFGCQFISFSSKTHWLFVSDEFLAQSDVFFAKLSDLMSADGISHDDIKRRGLRNHLPGFFVVERKTKTFSFVPHFIRVP